MDDLIGLLLLAIISGVVWLANKVKEANESRQQPPPVVPRDELPEKTREMLYGGEVRTARPKQGQPTQAQPLHPQTERTPPAVPAQRVPQPRASRELPPLSPRRTVVAAAPPAAPVAAEEMSPRELQARRERQEAAARQRQEAVARQRQALEDMSPRQLQALREQQEQAEQQRQLAEQARKIAEQKKAAASAARKRVAAEAPRAHKRRGALIGSSDDVRRGIVLAEILGPPKAMQ
jgi:hypothetical protein